ncbi:MAG: hypothetical protein EBV61_06000 [Actinobacteria bacterium]|nr:hypothetical protein [Actinomycetota bacterium]
MGKLSKSNNSQCDISQADLDRYESLDREWREYGLAAPARRALVDAKLFKVSDLRKISLNELEGLHGMGKSAIARLKVLMNAKKIKFRP